MAGFPLGGGGGPVPTNTRTDTSPVPTENLFFYSRPSTRTGGFQLWPQHPQFSSAPTTVLSFAHEPQIGTSSSSGARSGTSCQDCGNNAKKDCVHSRCRTCCRSRGLHCSTHVKSTWVPAAKRRERQHQLSALMGGGTSGSGTGEGSKRVKSDNTGMRLVPRAPTTIATTSSSGQGGRFPAEVSSEALFRCVKIGPLDEEGDEEMAYQTAVSIGGHVFKGILRDQGPETVDYNLMGSSPSVAHATSSEGGGGTGHIATSAAAVLMDPYPTPLGAFMQGTQFFPHQPRN